MRTILLSKGDEVYLQKCAVELGFAFGIVCGQRAEPEKYVVVHVAKNSEEDVEDDDPVHAAKGPKHIEDINTQALTNQWISASKMMPGSFTVLGVFVSGVNAHVLDEAAFRDAKKLLYDVHNLLIHCHNFCCTVDNDDDFDYLFLAYSTSAKRAVCKYYTHNNNGGAFTSMDCRFVEKPFEWHVFECNYELDDIFPILDGAQKINIERQFQRSIGAVRKSLSASEVFIQNESVDNELSLDAYIKKKSTQRKGQSRQSPEESFKVSIYLPVKCQTSSDEPIKVRQFNGTVRFSGIISSRIWCNPKNTLGEIKRYVRDDILRSLAARIQVYCDGLTEPNIHNESIFISEPPRRVYFNLHAGAGASTSANPIQFSEYIFRGEAPTVAVAQAKQVLDLDINSESIVADLEDLPDDDIFSDYSSDEQSLTQSASSRDLTRTMYMLGIAVSLFVLIVSVLLTYLLRQ